jgi:hypothetical protein
MDDREITALLQMYFHLLEGPVQEVQFLKEIFGQYLRVNSRRCCRWLGDTEHSLMHLFKLAGSWSIAEGNWVIHITHQPCRIYFKFRDSNFYGTRWWNNRMTFSTLPLQAVELMAGVLAMANEGLTRYSCCYTRRSRM